MSLREALLLCFRDEPQRIFGIQDLCLAVRRYYEVTPFQEELDPLHAQPRIDHEVRSQLARIKKQGHIERLGHNQYRLSSNHDTTRLPPKLTASGAYDTVQRQRL